MILVDTHTHIYLEHFEKDREAVITNAQEKGVKYMILPNVDERTIAPLNKLVNKNPNFLFPAMGLHPTSIQEDFEEQLEKIEKELNKGQYYAIGEIGIDLYWEKSFLKQQQLAFERQINWSIERELPIIIHARDSFNEIFEVLESFKDKQLQGVFHCFTGNMEEAQKAIDIGLYLGIGGVLTFKNAGLDKVIKNFELKHLLLETDAPYLAPTPYRGKRNEPSNVRLIARKMADIFGLELEKVAKITTNNAQNLFNLKFICDF